MKNLVEIQRHFFNAVIDNSDELTAEVIQQGSMTAFERVSIYIDAYRLRLIEALQDSYPALHTLMGDDDFEKLCLDYIDHVPSRHFSIRYFGHRLSEFVRDNVQYNNTELLSEMAKFEWALRAAFDAKDQLPLKLADLSLVAAEEWSALTFKTHASLKSLSLNWNVPALWQAIEQETPPQLPQQSEFPVHWLIWRPALETHFRSLNEQEAASFLLIQQGQSFGQLCESIASLDNDEQAAQQAAGYLARWIEEGLLNPNRSEPL